MASERSLRHASQTVTRNGRSYIMPRHIQIETVGGKGMCTARCDMCTINDWHKTPKIMANDEFKKFIDDLEPYREHVNYVTLHCNGEPLMDKQLHWKVKYLKDKGFRGTGFATNASLLTESRSRELIEAGLDTIIFSIDGATKQTHERIRQRLNFDKIVEEVLRFFSIRNAHADEGRRATRVIVRFILQPLNKHEWNDYQAFWSAHTRPELGDEVVFFPIHNWGGQLDAEKRMREMYGDTRELFQCEDMYERFIVFSDGEVSHCDADYNGFLKHANVFQTHFLDIYDDIVFNAYRSKMEEGNICDLKHCATCTIPLGRHKKGRAGEEYTPSGSDEQAY